MAPSASPRGLARPHAPPVRRTSREVSQRATSVAVVDDEEVPQITPAHLRRADEMCRRAVAHATGRVQFPGLFHDEEARDTIGKFGAIKKMLAEMAACRLVIETIDHVFSPIDVSAVSKDRTGLLKALVLTCLGTRPGSLAYNAGQIFGGTGYSEDDTLSKYYRDAAAWRYLVAPDSQLYRKHGDQLLRNWQRGRPRQTCSRPPPARGPVPAHQT